MCFTKLEKLINFQLWNFLGMKTDATEGADLTVNKYIFADPYKDYFGERQEKKRERMGKNEMQRLRNLARNKQQYGPGGRGGGANYEPLGVFNPDKRPEDSQSAEQVNFFWEFVENTVKTSVITAPLLTTDIQYIRGFV